MNKLTKIGMIALLLAGTAALSACSSNSKKADDAEQALIEQTQDLQVEQAFQDDPTMDEADLGASSSGLGH